MISGDLVSARRPELLDTVRPAVCGTSGVLSEGPSCDLGGGTAAGEPPAPHRADSPLGASRARALLAQLSAAAHR